MSVPNILSESSFSILTNQRIRVSENFVIKVTKENKIISKQVKESCKVIYFSIEWNFDEVLSTFDGLNPETYPNLFIFVVDALNLCDDQNKINKLTKSLLKFGEARPVILQLTSKCRAKFFYKEEVSTDIKIVGITNENFETNKKFSSFLCAFLTGKVHNFEDQMISTILSSPNCSLILRFLRTMNLNKNIFKKIIVEVSKHGKKYEFLAALDASLDGHGRMLNDQTHHLLSDTFLNDESVFLTAIKHKNKEIIDHIVTFWTLLVQQLPLEHKKIISTTAFETNQLDVLCDLLEVADFPFPNNFDVNSINHDRFKKIISIRKEFEESIVNESFHKIDEFIDNHLSLKIVFNSDNISSMNQAFNSKKFKAYFYLKSFGFQATSYIDLEETLTDEELEEAEDQAIKQRNKNVKEALRDVNNPVMLLSTRSFIHNRRTSKEKEVEYRIKIKKWLADIYKTKFGPDLLKTAALCENLKITFDFESSMVDRIDLLSNASGLSYSTVSSNIFIGAKLSDEKREQEIKGTLAHELCHYVMYLVYQNKFLPYYRYATDIQNIFDEIVKAIDQWSMPESENPDDECNEIISSVFTAYPSKCFSLELIVRTAHILAEFDNNTQMTEYLQEKYKILFEFWIKHVIPELRKFNLEVRNRVKKLNKYVGLLPSIANEEIEVGNSKDINKLIDNKLIVITTNIPKLLFVNIQQNLQEKFGNLLESRNFFYGSNKTQQSTNLERI